MLNIIATTAAIEALRATRGGHKSRSLILCLVRHSSSWQILYCDWRWLVDKRIELKDLACLTDDESALRSFRHKHGLSFPHAVSLQGFVLQLRGKGACWVGLC